MKISIITAVYNSAETIEDSLKSLQSQSYKDIEHIIIDGGSTDGTLEVVKQYSGPNEKIISEPDKGIYDALNKGIGEATGSIIGILHSDDIYAHGDILSKVAAVFEDESVDSCYGDLQYVDRVNTDKIIRHWKSKTYEKNMFYRGWMPPHPTFFVRRHLYERYGTFNLKLGTAADYELMLRFLLRYGVSTRYIPDVIVRMRAGGKSNESLFNRYKANRMDREAWRVNGLKPLYWTLVMKPLSKLSQYIIRH